MTAHILPCALEAQILFWIFSGFGLLWAYFKTTNLYKTTRRQETKQDDQPHR